MRQNMLRGVTVQLGARGKILAGFGANCPGPWGSPAETIGRGLREMESAGVRVAAVSPFYETAAIGRARQPPYVNAVAVLETDLPAEALLRLFKRVERQAGRRGGRPWGPRALDIDIVDYKGLVRHWRAGKGAFARAGARPLVLPHPLAHERPFVLAPLADIAPDWRHPVLGKSARDLLRRLPDGGQGAVLKRL
jgi:2-amino-4-hydroxy-6-hydroxymethyldihydropteridine diphosphokinase